MKRYKFIEPGYREEPVTITVSESWIEAMYYPQWKRKMRKAGRTHLISLNTCIIDFMVIHWAWEI